jgi:hypothetical protein
MSFIILLFFQPLNNIQWCSKETENVGEQYGGMLRFGTLSSFETSREEGC